MTDAMVYVVGLGPGDARYLTAQAQSALQAADVLCGYTVYIDLVRPLYPDKEVCTVWPARCWNWHRATQA